MDNDLTRVRFFVSVGLVGLLLIILSGFVGLFGFHFGLVISLFSGIFLTIIPYVMLYK